MSTAHSTWFEVGWTACAPTSLRDTEHQRSSSVGSFDTPAVATVAAVRASWVCVPLALAGSRAGEGAVPGGAVWGGGGGWGGCARARRRRGGGRGGGRPRGGGRLRAPPLKPAAGSGND